MIKITVFTPTYNRGYVIEKLYRSLQKQRFYNFEWIVIDDGSTDNTNLIFQRILADSNRFPITYLKVENGGKHRAINKGVQIAKGELFFIVDSDDFLTDDALEKIIEVEESINEKEKSSFAGLCGNRGYSKNEIIGSTYEGQFLDITQLERAKYGISGDKAEVFYTRILKKYPFPEFKGEKFITECVVWDKIAYDGFKLRFFNEVIYICNYLPDGLTAHSKEHFIASPRGYGLYIYQCGKYGKTYGVEKWETYWLYYHEFKDKLSFFAISNNLHINPIKFWIRLFGMKIFYKLYDR